MHWIPQWLGDCWESAEHPQRILLFTRDRIELGN